MGKKPSTHKGQSKKESQSILDAKANHRLWVKKNLKVAFIVLAVIVGTVLVIQGIVSFRGHLEALEGQKTIENYLEEKYDQDFVVEKPVHEGYGFAIEGVLKAQAYPKDNQSLKFFATTNSRGSSDKYPGAFWQQQAHDYVKPLIAKIFGYTPSYTIDVITYASKDNIIEGHLPNFTGALTEYKSQIGLSLIVTSREGINASNKKLVAQRTHDVAEDLKDLEVAYVHVEYKGATGGGLSHKLGGPNYPELNPSEPKQVQELINLVKEGQ